MHAFRLLILGIRYSFCSMACRMRMTYRSRIFPSLAAASSPLEKASDMACKHHSIPLTHLQNALSMATLLLVCGTPGDWTQIKCILCQHLDYGLLRAEIF